MKGLFRPDRHEVHAVRDVSFAIEPGELVGFIGPNGAGKSTTIKMLSGILYPTSGRVSVVGLSPQGKRRAVAQRIGAVFGQRSQLNWDLRLASPTPTRRSSNGETGSSASALRGARCLRRR